MWIQAKICLNNLSYEKTFENLKTKYTHMPEQTIKRKVSPREPQNAISTFFFMVLPAALFNHILERWVSFFSISTQATVISDLLDLLIISEPTYNSEPKKMHPT